MTVSVRVSVGPDEPKGANFQVESRGEGEKWTPAEVGTIEKGQDRVFPLYQEQRVVLSE